MQKDDTTDPLNQAFAALPREYPTDAAEEERTARALRAAGYLGRPRGTRRFVPMALRIAAAVALLATGFLYGTYRESRHTLEVLLAERDLDAAAHSALVQRAGSAYVRAIAEFGDAEAAPPEAREAALAALRAAALAVLRMDPASPLSSDLLRAINRGRREPARVIWF